MKVQVRNSKQEISSNICVFSKDVYEELKLEKDDIYTIHFGQISQSFYVQQTESAVSCIYFSGNGLKSLLLLEGLNLNIWREGNEIYLGPVVGIFVSQDHYPDVNKENDHPDVIQYIKASMAEGCFCYYFTTQDIDWTKNKIKGYSYKPSMNKWYCSWFPIPNVIYDRHRNYFEGRKKELLEWKRKRFSKYKKLYFINSINYLGGKWQQYKRLSKYNEIREFFPETIIYKSFKDVVQMLDKYKLVFIKSFFGSLGYGVIYIEQEMGQYRINYYDKVLKELLIKDIEEVEKLVESFREGRKFIIQQGIRFIKYKDRKFDIRAYIQKDGSGTWKSIRNYARIAQGSYALTNHALGADFAIYEHLYPHLKSPLCNVALPDSSKLSEAAIKIANCIDKEFGSEGELGLDLGIDAYGKVWFIEVNEKPGLEWNTDVVDIFNQNYIQLLFRMGKIKGDYLKIDPDNLDGILNNAQNIFKYAKFLAVKSV